MKSDKLTYPDLARIVGTGLISTGLGLLAFVCITITWGDPFTRLSARSSQNSLERRFAASVPDSESLTDASLDPAVTRRVAGLARRRSKLGSPIGKLSIPRIGLRRIIVNGARPKDLEKGPGLYRETLFPGSGRAVAIAGHRTTYGAPFLDIDQLRNGDPIVVTMPYGRFTYRVSRKAVITPSDWSILQFGAALPMPAARRAVQDTGNCSGTCEHLVLTACHPKYSAAKRLAVFARLSSVELV